MENNYTRLNLGCGEDEKKNYLNVDSNPNLNPDLVHDLDQLPYPFRNDSFELVECNHILEHLDKPFEIMRELHRILKPGGLLVVKVPHFSRGFTHAEHTHGFDVTFPLYFNENFTKSGYFGINFRLKKMELHWLAFFHLLRHANYGSITISLLKIVSSIISFLANINPNFCSRIWCFWVGGFDEIEFEFICKK